MEESGMVLLSFFLLSWCAELPSKLALWEDFELGIQKFRKVRTGENCCFRSLNFE